MPKVLSRQPRWLDYNTPAYHFFQPSDKNRTTQDAQEHGPRRRIAHRGTEIFTAVGNELRWSDLAILKEAAEDKTQGLPAYKVMDHIAAATKSC